MPLFTTSGTPNSVETLVGSNSERTQVIVHNGMSGATVRVDENRELVKASGNIIYYQDHIVFKGLIARGQIFVTSDIASSLVYYTEV